MPVTPLLNAQEVVKVFWVVRLAGLAAERQPYHLS